MKYKHHNVEYCRWAEKWHSVKGLISVLLVHAASDTCNAKTILKYSWDGVSASCKTSIFDFLIWVFVIADLAPYLWAEIKYFLSVSWCICCDNEFSCHSFYKPAGHDISLDKVNRFEYKIRKKLYLIRCVKSDHM